jgi:hypothetical protein
MKASRLVGGVLIVLGLSFGVAHAQILSEGFDSVTTLAPPATDGPITPTGWVGALRSSPLGVSGIFAGTVFPPHSGTGFIAANYQNTSGVGTISTWMISPELTMNNGDTVSFYTRVPDGSIWADRLQLRMSTAGSSTDVGATDTSVGDFTTVLLEVNPALNAPDYPQVWTEFTATISGLAGPTDGRLAFRYYVTSGGPSGTNSNYVGIDTFTYIPEPGTGMLTLLGLGFLGLCRRRA